MNKHTPLSLPPPVPWEFPVRHRHHGLVRIDPWHWLRERDDPRVLAHLEAENAHTESWFAQAGELTNHIYEEIINRIEESNFSVTYPDGNYLYQSRIGKGQDYRSYHRKPRFHEGEWQLYFDANREAGDAAYFDLGFLDVSPDGSLLAYAIDTAGEESYTLRFRDLNTGQDLPDVIENTSAEGEWDASGRHYYFVMEDDTRRPDRIYRHTIGTDPAAARLVYSEQDPRFHAGICKSQDRKYLFAISESKECSEVHYLDSSSADGPFQVLFPRQEVVQYWVDHHQGDWLIRTNQLAPDYKLLRLAVGETELASAETLVPARETVRLSDILVLKHHLLLFERTDGLDRIRVHAYRDGSEHFIQMQDAVYDLQESANVEYDTRFFNFTYSSPIRPSVTFRYNLDTRETEIIRMSRVPPKHDPDAYTVYRIHAPSVNGVLIPMTVVHHKSLQKDGNNPAFIHAYGAYGDFVEAEFRTAWLTWLERGFVVAIAHVRGGGLLGERWHQDGKLDKKENSFHDFVACTEALITSGYTRPEKIAIEGGSAGGLLVGAVLNYRPELFSAAVASVPFVDVLNTMLDPNLPLTTFEYEEWGDPADRKVFERLLAYSPYDNVRDAVYPAVFATAGFNDPRVPYWEAAKWVARLRKHQQGDKPILLRTNLETGHSGASGRYQYWREIAMEQAFILRTLDLSGAGAAHRA